MLEIKGKVTAFDRAGLQGANPSFDKKAGGCDMNIRQRQEEREELLLSPYAAKSGQSRGRVYPEPECDVRTAFQRDRDRILHSKAFRRLKGKTQVFIAPEGDHYRTRLTHTLEVAQISRTVARALGLNEDLTEAIALGHDLGHTPFGHAGEAALARVYEEGFCHNQQSLRVVEILERHIDAYPGLNLTFEVRDGILHHTGEQLPVTLEGQVVRICDRVAYINHDIDDAIRAGMLREEDLPEHCREVLGKGRRERIDTMVKDLIKASENKPRIVMSPAVDEATRALREFLFDHVYIGSAAKREEGKVKRLLTTLYYYYLEYPERLPAEWRQDRKDNAARLVVDYIAGMTDRYAMADYKNLFLPRGWSL